MVELRNGHFLQVAFHESAAAKHIMIVEPLRRIRFEVDMLGSFLNLLLSRSVLPKVIIIGRSNNVELGQGIMQAMSLAVGKGILLRKNALETLLRTKASIEERLPSTYSLHDFHG